MTVSSRFSGILVKSIYFGLDGKYGMRNGTEYEFYLCSKKSGTVKGFLPNMPEAWFEFSSLNIFFNHFKNVSLLGNYHLFFNTKNMFLRAEIVKTSLNA